MLQELKSLQQQGELVRIGSDRKGYWRVVLVGKQLS